MDDDRFDELIRALGDRFSRRRLGGLAVGAVCALDQAHPGAAKKHHHHKHKKKCKHGKERCGDECFDLQTDPRHCGKCGKKCPAVADCIDGGCVADHV